MLRQVHYKLLDYTAELIVQRGGPRIIKELADVEQREDDDEDVVDKISITIMDLMSPEPRPTCLDKAKAGMMSETERKSQLWGFEGGRRLEYADTLVDESIELSYDAVTARYWG